VNRECIRYVYERDTNASYCSDPDLDSEYAQETDCKGCPNFYDREDARNDSKFGHLDNY
jgi:hypothetical protein